MVEFISYKNEKYPIRVSYFTLVMAQKETGKADIGALDEDMESQETLLWYALQAGHKMADKELTLKREEMIWVLDECFMSFQQALMEFSKQIIDIQTAAFENTGNKKK